MEYYNVGNDVDEYHTKDLTKPSKMSLLKKCKGLSKQIIQTKQAAAGVADDIPKPTLDDDLLCQGLDIVDTPRKRLSRRDRHEQEMVCNKENGKDDVKGSQVVEG